MALYQPTNISPSSLNGTGVIDATQDLTVSWQINGYGGMIGWQIQIMQNDADSTLVYDSGMLHKEMVANGYVYYATVYGKNESGEDVPFSYTIPAEDLSGNVVNGYENGYKLRINQQYSETVSGGINYVTLAQISPVFFRAEANWTWTYYWSSTQTLREPQFTALDSSTSAPVLWHRWRLAGATTDELLYDSGRIYTDNNPYYSPKNLVNGATYHVRLDGQNTDGATADTDWVQFTVSYTLNANEHISCKAYYVAGMPCTYVTLETDDDAYRGYLFSYYGWGVYRVKTGSGLMELAAIIPNGQYSFYDFGIKNNTEYTYEVFSNHVGNGAYHYTSNAVKMSNYWNWSLVETVKRDYAFDHDGNYYPSNLSNIYNTMYHVTKVYQFQGNIKSGNITNDNSPFVGDNWTGYPIVQKSSRKGLSGTLKGMTGIVKNAAYTDSIDTIDDLTSLSTSESVKFLRDRKGNLRKVEIDGPIIKNTSDANAEQAVEIQIPWVETGDAAECQIVSTLDDGLLTWQNDLTVITTRLLYASPLAPGVYKWTASETTGGTVTLTAVSFSDSTETTAATITSAALSGTFTLTEVSRLYAAADSGSITLTAFVLTKIADYEAEDTPIEGQIDIAENGYGVQIGTLDAGTSYTWSYATADYASGATVTLRLVTQENTSFSQTDVATIDGETLTGTFSVDSTVSSASLWLITDTAAAVQITGWELTASGVSPDAEPAVTSSDVNYLLASNLSAGTWQYELDTVTYENTIVGRITTVSDGTVLQQFAIGGDVTGSFTSSEAVNLYIYNASGTEFTIGSYTLTQTAEPEDEDTGIVVQQDLTVQGTLLYGAYTLPGYYSILNLKADSYSVSSANSNMYITFVNEDSTVTSYSINAPTIVNGYSPGLFNNVLRITLSYALPSTVPPLTYTNLVIRDSTADTTLTTFTSLTPNYETLLTTPLTAGSYSIYGTSITGTARVTFFTSEGTGQSVTLDSSNITTSQTVTMETAVNQIYVECPYDEECTITGLTIVKN